MPRGSPSSFAAGRWPINSNRVSPLSVLETFSTWAPVVFIRDSKYGMPAVQSVHLTGLTILFATLLALNLRLAGLGMRDFAPPVLYLQLRPWMRAGAALVILSGFTIFIATPRKYLGSHPFQIKMAALGLAILFHFLALRKIVASAGPKPRRADVVAAALSLTLWFSVGWAGRAIAFVP